MEKARPVTPEWLTGILGEQGDLGRERVIRIDVLNSYFTFTSRIDHLAVAYSSEHARSQPRRLFLKVPRADVSPEITSSFRREVLFYCHPAPAVTRTVATIRCYSAAYCPRTGQAHLLLEDVSDTHVGCEWPIPPEDQQCEAAVTYLARLHACLWQSPLLDEIVPAEEQEKDAEESQSIEQIVKRGKAFLKFLAGRLCVEDRHRFAKALTRLPAQWKYFNGKARTFLFGDAHFSNFLYPRLETKGAVLACDWQHWQAGPAAFDLSYMIALNLHPQRRQRMEMSLLRHYHEVLLANHVKTYLWQDLLWEYRLFLYRHLLIVPAWQWSLGVPATVWWSHIERGFSAWRELGCDEFLDTT